MKRGRFAILLLSEVDEMLIMLEKEIKLFFLSDISALIFNFFLILCIPGMISR